MSNPYAPQQIHPMGGDPILLGEIKSHATTALVMGILSLFCFGIILAPFAIYRGNYAKNLIAESGIGQEHRGIAQAGFIIGIVSLTLNAVGILFYIAVVVFTVSAQ